jgi:hypothetical protein
MLRQGDVLLIPVDAIPATATRRFGPLVLAYGEATGHAHTVESDAEIVDAFLADLDGQTYLSAPATARVVHQEHGPLVLDGKPYRVVRQVEWTDEMEPRRVAD